MNLFERTDSKARISSCGKYRYSLMRAWSDKPRVGWIMLNPSTADAQVDDPTIRRCMSFARAWGFGGIEVRNLFALRATDPSALGRDISLEDAVGPDNDKAVCELLQLPRIIAAWGANGGLGSRDAAVCSLVLAAGAHLYCLGTTQAGQPRHPLYMSDRTRPVRFIEARSLCGGLR